MREILRLTFRNLAASKLRFLLTSFAVLMGVSFVVSSFVLTDGLTKTFDAIVEDSNSGLDAQVRATVDFEEVAFVDLPIDEGLVEVVAGVDGVDVAEPGFQSMLLVRSSRARPHRSWVCRWSTFRGAAPPATWLERTPPATTSERRRQRPG